MTPLDCLPLYQDAVFYDLEFDSRAHEIPFYLRHALTAAGPVLELACGTGRLTLPLAAAGVPITGVDVSAPMIEQARSKSAAAGLAIDWHVQDVRALQLERRFALAFIATNALQHLEDLPSLRAFFARIREHLLPRGLLIVDVFQPNLVKLARSLGHPRRHKSFPLPDGSAVEVTTDSEYFADVQVLHFVLSYRSQGQLIRTKDVRMRCFFPEELLALCEAGGFQVEQRFGGYDESSFTASSPKQLLFCRLK